MTDRSSTVSAGSGGGFRIRRVNGPDQTPDAAPAELDGAAVLRWHPDIATVPAGDELVVYAHASTTSHVLDPMAGLLWECLDGRSTLNDIFFDIASAYGVPGTQVTNDFLPIVARWQAAGIVEEVTND